MATFTIAGRLTEAGTVEARPIPSNAKDPDTGAGLSPVSAVASPAFSIQVPSVPGVKWQVSGINRVGKAGSRIVLRDTNTGLSLWVPAAPVINGGGGGGGGGAAPDLSGYLTKSEAANSYATKSDLGNVQSKPGPQGEKGEQGEPGQPGARGERGPEGPAGPRGQAGQAGPRGERGPEGPRGADGAPGQTGPQGPAGQRGEPGPQGAPGAAGERGPKGDPGPAPDTSVFLTKESAGETYATKEALAKAQLGGAGQAPDLSAYLTTAKASETYATKAEVKGIQLTPGPKGDKGEAGPAGAPGERGPAGEAGARGERGPAGEAGAAGAPGPRGETGPQGPPGPAGPAGEPGQPGARGERGPEGPAGRDGTPADLSAYATKEDLKGMAGKAEEALVKARAAAYPFDNGGRYFSPVTYYWPDYYNAGQAGKTSKWADTLTMGNSLGIVILNRNSGDWSTFEQDFKTQGELALAAGAKRVVFYVKTQYGVAPLPPSDPARAGVPNPDKFTEAYILDMVRKAKSQYGALCQGVFLDEFINGHGDQAGRIPWYRELVRKIREEHGADFLIVGNSGSNIADDVVALSDVDVFMMFEKDAKQFLVEDQNAPIFTPRMKQEPSTRWWIVVHGVSKANYQQVFDKAASLPVSHLYLTDGVLVEDPERGGQWEPVGNPYANPPSKPFMSLASKWVRGVLDLALGLDSTTARVDALEKKPGGGPAPDLTGYLKEEAADAKYAPKADGTKGKEAWDALVALNMKLGGLGTSTLADNLSSRITRLDQTGRYANEAKTRVGLLEPKVAAVETEFREIGTTLGADARHPLKDVLYQMQQEAGNAHAALQGLNGEITALKAELAKRAQVLVLGLDDPVPPGTPADTVIVRRQK